MKKNKTEADLNFITTREITVVYYVEDYGEVVAVINRGRGELYGECTSC